jgi:hypothetical protein
MLNGFSSRDSLPAPLPANTPVPQKMMEKCTRVWREGKARKLVKFSLIAIRYFYGSYDTPGTIGRGTLGARRQPVAARIWFPLLSIFCCGGNTKVQ